MSRAIRRLLSTRTRRAVAILVVLAVIGGSVARVYACFGVDVAAFALAGWTTLFALLSLVFVFWRPFSPRPALDVSLSLDGMPTRELDIHPFPVARIDHKAILASQRARAEATVQPPPPPQTRHPWEFPAPMVSSYEPYRDSLARFRTELASYENRLRDWLREYESAQWPASAYIEAFVRVENTGDGPADGIRVRLVLPDGLSATQVAPSVAAPPQRPRFRRRGRFDFIPPDIASAFPKRETEPRDVRVGRLDGPRYANEDGTAVAEFTAQDLTHGVADVSAYPLRLIPGGPGEYKIMWEAHAKNLTVPSTGQIMIRVSAPAEPHERLTKLGAVLARGGVVVRGRDE